MHESVDNYHDFLLLGFKMRIWHAAWYRLIHKQGLSVNKAVRNQVVDNVPCNVNNDLIHWHVKCNITQDLSKKNVCLHILLFVHQWQAYLHSMQHLMHCQQHVNSKDTDLKNKWSCWSTCSNESTGLLPRNWHQSFMPSVELAVDHIAD